MNKIINDKNETVISVGAPGSLERVKVEHPMLIEKLNALFNCEAKIDEAVEAIRFAGIRSEIETNSLLQASHFGVSPSPVMQLVCAIARPNRTLFVEIYARRMKTHSDANPGMYRVPESWTALAEKMTDGLISGRANLSTVAKAALKECGATPTYAGAKDFLS